MICQRRLRRGSLYMMSVETAACIEMALPYRFWKRIHSRARAVPIEGVHNFSHSMGHGGRSDREMPEDAQLGLDELALCLASMRIFAE